MPIVDPGPFWKVGFSLDHAMTEFSHSLGRECEFDPSCSGHSVGSWLSNWRPATLYDCSPFDTCH
jgi:putative component of membrane protein insertase Oxa1/YidC/SpoIIIJ protein YidD